MCGETGLHRTHDVYGLIEIAGPIVSHQDRLAGAFPLREDQSRSSDIRHAHTGGKVQDLAKYLASKAALSIHLKCDRCPPPGLEHYFVRFCRNLEIRRRRDRHHLERLAALSVVLHFATFDLRASNDLERCGSGIQ